MIRSSRISRWTGSHDARGVKRETLLPSQTRSADSTVAERAEAALQVALVALGAARDELRRVRAHDRTVSMIEAATGTLGLIGLTTTGIAGSFHDQPVLVGLFVVASAVPIAMSIRKAALGQARESDRAVAVETARAAALNAAAFRDAAVELANTEADPSGSKGLVDTILVNVEQSAAVASGREKRARGAFGEQARRHIRIKPINDSIVVTRSDGVTIIAQIVDVSRSGIALSGALPDIAVGDHVLVGSRAARVVRTLPHGIACEFVKTLPPAQLDFDIVL